jgi:magnesium-transporting ATPase (P-type)
MDYYKQHTDELINQLNSNVLNGLDEKAIQSAKQKFGKNIFETAGTRRIYQLLLGQFTSPLIIILPAAAKRRTHPFNHCRNERIDWVLPGMEIREHIIVYKKISG